MVDFPFDESVLSTFLSDLTPFTEYSCTISASTGAGEGNASILMVAATDEDGKHNYKFFRESVVLLCNTCMVCDKNFYLNHSSI